MLPRTQVLRIHQAAIFRLGCVLLRLAPGFDSHMPGFESVSFWSGPGPHFLCAVGVDRAASSSARCWARPRRSPRTWTTRSVKSAMLGRIRRLCLQLAFCLRLRLLRVLAIARCAACVALRTALCLSGGAALRLATQPVSPQSSCSQAPLNPFFVILLRAQNDTFQRIVQRVRNVVSAEHALLYLGENSSVAVLFSWL